MFRMAHRQGSDSSCVLVHEIGTFHFEHERPKQVLAFESTLSEGRLAALNSMLNTDQFHRLPKAVAIDLRPSGLDELTLSVPRQDQWVSLRFVSGPANDHVQWLLNQFLRWKSGVLRNPHRKLREESGRNNCLPARRQN